MSWRRPPFHKSTTDLNGDELQQFISYPNGGHPVPPSLSMALCFALGLELRVPRRLYLTEIKTITARSQDAHQSWFKASICMDSLLSRSDSPFWPLCYSRGRIPSPACTVSNRLCRGFYRAPPFKRYHWTLEIQPIPRHCAALYRQRFIQPGAARRPRRSCPTLHHHGGLIRLHDSRSGFPLRHLRQRYSCLRALARFWRPDHRG